MTKGNVPQIAESEWHVMKVLWKEHPLSAGEVIERLSASSGWKPKTVKTLIGRLVNKKALGFRENGRAYTYFPLVEEEECIRHEHRSFLNRIYGGSLHPMLVRFLQEERLTPDEIEQLKRILEEKGAP